MRIHHTVSKIVKISSRIKQQSRNLEFDADHGQHAHAAMALGRIEMLGEMLMTLSRIGQDELLDEIAARKEVTPCTAS